MDLPPHTELFATTRRMAQSNYYRGMLGLPWAHRYKGREVFVLYDPKDPKSRASKHFFGAERSWLDRARCRHWPDLSWNLGAPVSWNSIAKRDNVAWRANLYCRALVEAWYAYFFC